MKKGTTLQAAKKLNGEGFVKGHDFSRADKANQIKGALAPEGCFFLRCLKFSVFPQPLESFRNKYHKGREIILAAFLNCQPVPPESTA